MDPQQIIPNPWELQPCCIMKNGAAIEGTLQKWAPKNLVSFNKGKCKVLHLGQNNPTDLLDSKLNVSQQHALEVKRPAAYWEVLVSVWEGCKGSCFFPCMQHF